MKVPFRLSSLPLFPISDFLPSLVPGFSILSCFLFPFPLAPPFPFLSSAVWDLDNITEYLAAAI